MYYDELLVGTGTGLYAHQVFDDSVTGVPNRRHLCPKRWLPFRPSPIPQRASSR